MGVDESTAVGGSVGASDPRRKGGSPRGSRRGALGAPGAAPLELWALGTAAAATRSVCGVAEPAPPLSGQADRDGGRARRGDGAAAANAEVPSTWGSVDHRKASIARRVVRQSPSQPVASLASDWTGLTSGIGGALAYSCVKSLSHNAAMTCKASLSPWAARVM